MERFNSFKPMVVLLERLIHLSQEQLAISTKLVEIVIEIKRAQEVTNQKLDIIISTLTLPKIATIRGVYGPPEQN